MPYVLDLVWLIPALPLLGMLITGLGGRFSREAGSAWPPRISHGAAVMLSLLICDRGGVQRGAEQ